MPDSPPGFHVLFAAHTERLLEALAREIEVPLGDPTKRECIVVQSQGMSRWLELQLSARFGIWANPWFPFPEELSYFLWRDMALPDGPSSRGAFDREGLAWSVAAVLPELLDRPEFEPLRTWVGSAREPARVMTLARRIGAVFYGYILNRPDLILHWEDESAATWLPPGMPEAAAEDAAWQAALWREVVSRSTAIHPARRAAALLAALHDGDGSITDRLWRFRRVSVFGLSALSPLYVEILAVLGRHIPVRLYSLAASPADARRVVAVVQATMWDPHEMVPEKQAEGLLAELRPVHPLVEDQASAVRSFQMVVALHGASVTALEDDAEDGPVPSSPSSPASLRSSLSPSPSLSVAPQRSTSLLTFLQADVARGEGPTPQPAAVQAVLAGQDHSLGLHSCHGPLREVEVVRDQLLAAFDELGGLAPHDVVVMVPDVEAYAPYVEAVFGTGQRGGLSIPFRVADRLPRAERPGALAFSRALHVLRGRMTAPEVLDLLSLAPVRSARGLDEEALEQLRAWIEAAGIRWGLDGEHRAAVGQPALAANTWRWGLTRLVLGWAAPGDGRGRFVDVLPSAPGGAEPALLGVLADFWDFLGRWRGALLEARWTVDQWLPELGRMLLELVGAGSATEDDRLLVEATLGKLAERAQEAGYRSTLGLDAMANLVDAALAEEPPPRGFLEGAVTVCALQPMRAIPFRMVALMGLNDGAFPRTDRPPGFDLAARQPRLGDTLRRDTDRLLFLEALACARDRVVITWTGQDPRTDAELPPSVVVSELVDVLRQMARPGEETDKGPATDSDGARMRTIDDLVLKHPMHPFSPRYFGADPDRRLFSYMTAYARTAGAGDGARRERPPVVSAPLPAPERGDEERLVPLAALAHFLEAPARRLVRDRLGIDLPERHEPLPDREPMTLSALDRYWVGESLLAARLAGASSDEAVAIAAADGRLPLGTPGRLAVAPVQATAERLAALVTPLRQGGEVRTEPIDLPFPELGARVSGSLDQLWPRGRLEVGYGRLDARRELRLWVRHLALNVALGEGAVTGCAPVSWAIGRTGRGDGLALVQYGAVADARDRLLEILGLWFEAEMALVPFFPRAAQAYVETLAAGDAAATPDEGAIAAAERAAADAFGAGRREIDPTDSWRSTVDLDDPHLSLALGDALPWDEDGQVADEPMVARFEVLAWEVLGPVAAAATRAKDDAARALVAEATA